MSQLTAAHARQLLAALKEGGFVKISPPTLAVHQAKRTITVAKSREGINGRLSFHELELEDGTSELSLSLLLKPAPFNLLSTSIPDASTGDDNDQP